MTGRTARTLGAMTAALASGLVLACTAGAAPTEQFTRFPRSGSINSSSDIPLAVDAEPFKMLTTLVAGYWQIPIDSETVATPGNRDGSDSIGFSSTLPEQEL